MGAHRARLGNGLLPDLEIALRVIRAPVEGLSTALLRADLDDVAAALGARHAQRYRLGVLALRVAGARQELAVTTVADRHRLTALVALVVRELRNLGLLAFFVEVLGVLARRVFL